MVDLAGDFVEREGVGDLLAAAEAVALEDGRLAGGEAFAGEVGDFGLGFGLQNARDGCFQAAITLGGLDDEA